MFLLLTLNIFHNFSSISIVDLEQANLAGLFQVNNKNNSLSGFIVDLSANKFS